MRGENVQAAVDSLVPGLQIPEGDQLLELCHKVVLVLFIDIRLQQGGTDWLVGWSVSVSLMGCFLFLFLCRGGPLGYLLPGV